LTEAELAAIETHGLYNLADFLPKKPSEAELRIMKEMFEASVDGRPYDTDKWGAYYRPYGIDAPAGTSAEKQTGGDSHKHPQPAAPTVTHSSDPDDVPFEADQPIVVPTTTSSDKAQDILAMIRARTPK
jgi:hypothetical protein